MPETEQQSAQPAQPTQQTVEPGPLPEVRQCQDAENGQYGASAVASGTNRWGVMLPINPETGAGGGHWATDDEVVEWKVLS